MICSFSFYRSDANLFCIRVLPLWSQHHYLDVIFLDSNWTCGGLTYPWSCQWSINNQAEALSHWVRWTFQDPIAFLCMEEIWGNNWIWRHSFAKVLWAAWKQEGLLECWTLSSGAITMFWVIFLLDLHKRCNDVNWQTNNRTLESFFMNEILTFKSFLAITNCMEIHRVPFFSILIPHEWESWGRETALHRMIKWLRLPPSVWFTFHSFTPFNTSLI